MHLIGIAIHEEDSAMQYLGPSLVGVAFWLFIGAMAVAVMITDYQRRRGGMEPDRG
jgi:hypothetical protein